MKLIFTSDGTFPVSVCERDGLRSAIGPNVLQSQDEWTPPFFGELHFSYADHRYGLLLFSQPDSIYGLINISEPKRHSHVLNSTAGPRCIYGHSELKIKKNGDFDLDYYII